MSSKGERAARERLEALEIRILRAVPPLPDEFWMLKEEIRRVLDDGALDGCLKQSVPGDRAVVQDQPRP